MSDGPAEVGLQASDGKSRAGRKSTDRVQFAWLNGFRRERRPMEVFLVNGHRITGRIRSFDQRAILLEAPGGDVILLLHHVISTIQPSRGRRGGGGRGSSESRPRSAPPPEARRHQPQRMPADDPYERPAAPKKPTVTIIRKHRRIVRDEE